MRSPADAQSKDISMGHGENGATCAAAETPRAAFDSGEGDFLAEVELDVPPPPSPLAAIQSTPQRPRVAAAPSGQSNPARPEPPQIAPQLTAEETAAAQQQTNLSLSIAERNLAAARGRSVECRSVRSGLQGAQFRHRGARRGARRRLDTREQCRKEGASTLRGTCRFALSSLSSYRRGPASTRSFHLRWGSAAWVC